MKSGLTNGKPRLSLLPRRALVWLTRALEYGISPGKYKRGNYHGVPPEGVDNLDRIAGYLDAAMRHLTEVTQAYNVACGTGGDRAAALATIDPESGLPHLACVLASVGLGIECGADAGVLEVDPGQTWRGVVAQERSTEALWKGYRHADVFKVINKITKDCGIVGADDRWRFVEERIERRTEGNWGPTSWAAQEDRLRAAGLRRPDEPDYAPVKT